MEKIIDTKLLEERVESINKHFNTCSSLEPRLQRRVYSGEEVCGLFTLDICAQTANENYKTKGESPSSFDLKQFLYFASDLFMSSLDNSAKKSFMEYLNSEEGEKDFDELEHIRGYFLHSNY